MHWLDRLARYTTTRLPTHKRPFHQGWGDATELDWYVNEAARVPPVSPIEVTLRPARRSGAVVMRDLEFDSPFSRLPDAVRRVRGRWITGHLETESVAILHASWNDEDYTTRSRFAFDLLDHGISSIMLQHPFYGDRRRAPTDRIPAATVSDFCLMGRGAVLEGRSLAVWLMERGHRVGVAGYSMGGNIAGFVGMLVPFPVATSAAASSYAAGPPLLQGVLRRGLAWDALGGDTAEVEERLSVVLHAGSILNHAPPDHMAAATLIAGTVDGYVPTAATQAIHRHWRGSKLEWVNAGHASLLWRRRDRIVGAIVESFERAREWQNTVPGSASSP